jgi:pantothenate kinase
MKLIKESQTHSLFFIMIIFGPSPSSRRERLEVNEKEKKKIFRSSSQITIIFYTLPLLLIKYILITELNTESSINDAVINRQSKGSRNMSQQTKLIAICTVAVISLAGMGYAFLRYRSIAERKRRKLEKAERTVNIGAIFGMDVGGTLTKVVYFEKAGVLDRQDAQSTHPSMPAVSRAVSDPTSERSGTGLGQGLKRTNSLSKMLEAPDHKRALQTLYEYMRTSKNPGTRRDDRLSFYSPFFDGCFHFLHFETRDMTKIIDRLTDASITENIRTIGCTGGGAHKYAKKVRDDLDIEILQADELECLIRGMLYALTHIQNECYTFRRDNGQSEEFQSPSRKEHTKKVSLPREQLDNTFPYLVVNIGSGVSILKVCGPNDYERVSGSSIGGGTCWGLCRLLTKSSSFESALDMAEKGDSSEIDMLVGDIYGGDCKFILT